MVYKVVEKYTAHHRSEIKGWRGKKRGGLMLEQETFCCDRCGRTFVQKVEEIDFTGNFFHRFTAYFGYGSPFDDEKVDFCLCELCLFELLRTFKHQPEIDGENVVTAFDRYRESYQELEK